MKVLLVNPEYPVTFWSFKHVLRFVSKKAAYPPLGLLTVAGLAPSDWELRLRDLNVEKLGRRDLSWADLVLVGAMLIQRDSTLEVLERCRRAKVGIVAGGPLFSGAPEEFSPLVDHLFLGEAELTFPRFVRDLERGDPQKIYRSETFPDLANAPIPRWDLIKASNYATFTIQSSRGCPFNCEFCDITNMFGRVPRVKSADQLMRELRAIYDLGYRDRVFFVDDNFIGNKTKIKEILPRLIEWMKAHDYPFPLITEASINLSDDRELIELMVEANFDTVFIGLETPNEDSLRECEKNQNRGRDLVASVAVLQEAGLQVFGGYIVGFDSDDENIFHRQIKFIQESGVVTAMVGLLNALPNTKLWRRLKDEGRLLVEASGDNTDGTINFIPKMDMEKLIEGYREVVRTIYGHRAFYQRVSNFLERYQPRHKKKKLKLKDIGVFFRSIFYLGVLGDGRSQWYFWKMFFKSVIFHRNAFLEAMTLMVYGHHFRKVAKKV
ncbi:MAG: B12-binding domain-containing radical SAM protein [Pseudomonadota bacterium]